MATLPDFDKMVGLIEVINQLSKAKMLLDIEIKFDEAEIVKKATTLPEYFVNGKTPSMEYIKSSLMFTGLNGEIIEKRKILADISSELEKSRSTLQLQKDILDAWRTEQANERKAVL